MGLATQKASAPTLHFEVGAIFSSVRGFLQVVSSGIIPSKLHGLYMVAGIEPRLIMYRTNKHGTPITWTEDGTGGGMVVNMSLLPLLATELPFPI